MVVCLLCCMLSARGFRDGPTPCTEESYRLWWVILCDMETLRTRRLWPALGCCAREREVKNSFSTDCATRLHSYRLSSTLLCLKKLKSGFKHYKWHLLHLRTCSNMLNCKSGVRQIHASHSFASSMDLVKCRQLQFYLSQLNISQGSTATFASFLIYVSLQSAFRFSVPLLLRFSS